MYCPKCLEKQINIRTRVIDTRLQSDLIVRRRRLCLNCKGRFTTWESPMTIDSRESLSNILKKRISKIKKQAQEIVESIKDE